MLNVPLLTIFLQVQTDFQQISEAQFAITILDADNINHLVVFLTGTVPFPDGFGGSGILVETSNLCTRWLFGAQNITVCI